MSLPCGDGRGAGKMQGQFALVSYLPEPLASFLDRLRLDLDPECKPHAHVTILPPRPMTGDVTQAIEELKEESRLFPQLEIDLGNVEMFPVSNVIYLDLARGGQSVHELHDLLEQGSLKHQCVFEFHPHITIGQDLKPERIQEALRIARAEWAAYEGRRSFVVDSLSFVQNITTGVWNDLARIPLAVPVPAVN